jgi:hypothetical protein
MNMHAGYSAIALCVIVGCGGTVMSQSKLADSEGAVRSADEVGARQVPAAGLQLKLAEDELGRAKGLSENGEGEKANRLLTRAQVDADLAIALAKEAAAAKSAEAVMSDVRSAKAEVAP